VVRLRGGPAAEERHGAGEGQGGERGAVREVHAGGLQAADYGRVRPRC